MLRLSAALICGVLTLGAAAPPNTVLLRDWSGKRGGGSQPVTISRVFAEGDIPHFAQARVNGAPVLTQCDVKTRWKDGSVQHAILSFVAPARNSNVDFLDQETGNEQDFFTRDQILAASFNAAMQFRGPADSTVSVDVRRILEDWDGKPSDAGVRYWLKGAVATRIIVEDRSPATRYDFGWSGETPATALEHKSLHPMFVLTFYRGFPGVQVEFILENTWTGRLQDQVYSVTLQTGSPLRTVYEEENFRHLAKTRWRRTFWSGPQPASPTIDHNLPYLIHSRLLPSFDLSLNPPPERSRHYDDDDRPGRRPAPPRRGLGSAGVIQTKFPTTGGNARAEVGLLPRWEVRYLYTADSESRDIMLTHGETGAHVPVHLRESAGGRTFDRPSGTAAFGRSISLDARPTARPIRESRGTTPADALGVVGPVSAGHWVVDQAHQPEFAFLPYFLTGDWYFLEELYFWSSYNLVWGAVGECNYCRGRFGYLHDQVRGEAWALRTLARTAFAAPDGTPEKRYFTRMLHDNIAVREGKFDVRNGAFYDPKPGSAWRWGRDVVGRGEENPLLFQSFGAPMDSKAPDLDRTKTATYDRAWMYGYVHVVWGHIEELGFPIRVLRETVATNFLNQILHPDYNPYLVGGYSMPVRECIGWDGTRCQSSRFFDSWEKVKQAYVQPDIKEWGNASDPHLPEGGYAVIARAAVSFMTNIKTGTLDGSGAWQWLNTHLPHLDRLQENPKWALVPRGSQDLAAAWKRIASRRK